MTSRLHAAALRLAVGFALVPLAASASATEPARPVTESFLRGAIVSCPGWGPIWGSPAMTESVSQLREIGVEWVAIHPYGWVKRDGRVEFRPAGSLAFLDKAVERSRNEGARLFWKPHMGYWGQFDWRGVIEFGEDEAAWLRFFRDYRAFIVDQAAFAERFGIPLFAVGVELEATTHREKEWREILAAVRGVYSGDLVYAANWDALEKVPFWDAVDLIGVHAYFPLSRESDASRAALAVGWEAPLSRLRALSERHGKKILFAEIGYNVNADAARKPWSYRTDDTVENRALRRRLMEIAIERVEGEPFVAGMFWWKWMPGPRSRNFSLRDPEARAAIAKYWAEAGAAEVQSGSQTTAE